VLVGVRNRNRDETVSQDSFSAHANFAAERMEMTDDMVSASG
jgi:hypothetical protein